MTMNGTIHKNGNNGSSSIRTDFAKTMLRSFDSLVETGEIVWAPFRQDPVECNGFKAVFQLSPHLRRKPIQAADAPERKTGQGSNPFLHPEESFILSNIGQHHVLIYNKYCVYRPSLILITKEFVPQTATLDGPDLEASWSVVNYLAGEEGKEYMMIYNCGIDSGSSQGHKHMQLWRLPGKNEMGFELFPSQATSTETITTGIRNVPHKHFVLRFKQGATAEDVFDAHQKLLAEIDRCHEQYGSTAHNVVLTREWICLIPRRSNGVEHGAGSNAAGVLGLIWISSEDEKDIWTDPSLNNYIAGLGVPVD